MKNSIKEHKTNRCRLEDQSVVSLRIKMGVIFLWINSVCGFGRRFFRSSICATNSPIALQAILLICWPMVLIGSGISSLLGITEPAIFGVNLKLRYPFYGALIGGGIGAAYATLMSVLSVSQGPCGVIGVICIRPDCMLQFLVSIVVAMACAFAATMFLGKAFGKKEAEKAAPPVQSSAAGTAVLHIEDRSAAGSNTNAEKVIYAPIQGNVIPREDITDETFASGVLGEGVGIEPKSGEVVAPFDGEISSLTDTRHAVGISGPGGMEFLIHVGVDTVKMNGDGFRLFVSEGEKVRRGQKLMTFDIAKIKAAGFCPTSAVLLTNSDDYKSCNVIKTGMTETQEKIISVDE